ncbi:MAG: fumarylacetoacetate hydrolase family protein [Candidatus Hodarchaeales archaeon]|jgi:2-keto-4-pentenoate hydratase/2-oxohepta-3-ene-1,7-dioic acid hydratase in catechol pathway
MKIGISEGSVVTWNDHETKKFPTMDSIVPFITDPLLLDRTGNILLNEIPRLQLPLVPPKIVCLARNYSAHALEMGIDPSKLPPFPPLFLKPSSSVIGPGEKIVIPNQTREVHHEVELAVVVGKKGKNISKENANEHIFGYTILLDITARDIQSIAKEKGHPWFIAKGFDTFCPLGPIIVTADEINNPHSLSIRLKVNDEIRQNGNTRDMIHKINSIIEYCSSVLTLEPGDVIATGTPEGVGKFDRGDVLQASIEKIGTLTVGVD